MNYYALNTKSAHPDLYTDLRMGLESYYKPIRPTGAVDYDMLYKHGQELHSMVIDHDDEKERATLGAILRDATTVNSNLLDPLLLFYRLPPLSIMHYALKDEGFKEERQEALEKFQSELPEIYDVMEAKIKSGDKNRTSSIDLENKHLEHEDPYINLKMNLARYPMPVHPAGATDHNALRKHGEEIYNLVTAVPDNEQRSVALRSALREAVTENSNLLQSLLVFYKLPTLDTLRDHLDNFDILEEEHDALGRFHSELPEIYEVLVKEHLQFDCALSRLMNHQDLTLSP